LLDQKIYPTDSFAEALKADPQRVYRKILNRANNAKIKGRSTFSFPEARPVLLRMLGAIDKRIDSDPAFQELKTEGERLLKKNIPYHAYIQYALKFTKAFDQVTRREHPEYTSHYNEGLAVHLYQPLIDRAPDAILWPSFASVDELFFIQARQVPVYFIQLDTGLGFADGYVLPPLEDLMHDVGHTQYKDMAEKRAGTRNLHTRGRNTVVLLNELSTIKKSDTSLHDAERLILFEIFHERGYTVDLPVIRAQLETAKWTGVIERKLESGYYGKHSKTSPAFSRLTEGRERLLKLVQELTAKEVFHRIKRLQARGEETINVSYTPALESHFGQAKHIEFLGPGLLEVRFDENGKEVTCPSIRDISLAQIDAIQNSPLTPTFTKEIEQALLEKEQGLVLNIYFDVTDTTIRVVKNPVLKNLNVTTLRKVDVSPKLDPLEVFKINQLLNLNQKGQEANFTLMKPVVNFEGRVTELTKTSVTIYDGSNSFTFPLSQLIVQ